MFSPWFCLTRAYIIKPPNVKKQFCRWHRRCVRAYKLSQRRIKRNYWSGHIARAIRLCSYYSDYKPLNYDCLCSVHKSTYDIRYGESAARVVVFIFLVIKAPITVDIYKSVFFCMFVKKILNTYILNKFWIYRQIFTLGFNIKYCWKINPRKYRIENVTEMNTYFN